MKDLGCAVYMPIAPVQRTKMIHNVEYKFMLILILYLFLDSLNL